MAKRSKGLRRAIEITVEIQSGTKRPEVAKKIQAALLQVPTDVFEAGETIVVRPQVEGPKPPRKLPEKKV